MTEPSNPIETVSEMNGYQEPLDDDTEGCISDVVDASISFERFGELPAQFRILDSRTDALRSRIRELVEEARLQAGKDLVHVLTRSADK